MQTTLPRCSLPRAAVAAACLSMALAAQAATFSVLHEFAGADGNMPFGELALDSAGDLYGTTYAGGASNAGTLFKYDGVQFTTLHSFTGGADGGYPHGGLLADGEGNLHGTTMTGGGAFGSVFRWDREATPHLRTLKGFADRAADGIQPFGGLTRDADGTIYGATFYGGDLNCGTPNLGCGTVFKISPAGTFTQLHRLSTSEGYGPSGTLRRLGDKLYGATVYGGSPFSVKTDGSAFAMSPAPGNLYTFVSGLVADGAGNLWGTAFSGGAHKLGGIYKIDAAGNSTLVYSFAGSDGANPTGTPVIDARGVLYGTTQGAAVWNREGSGVGGWGTVWQFDTRSGVLTTLHRFVGSDGKNPQAGLVRDLQGNLYGVASFGGSQDMGVVFRVTP